MGKSQQVLLKNWFSILDHLDEIFLFIGNDTEILHANSAYSRLIGVPRNKVIGRRLSDIEPKARIIEVLESERPVYHDYSYIESVGMDIVGNSFPVYDEEGEKVGAIGIFRPVSLFSADSSLPSPPVWCKKEKAVEGEDPFSRLIGESRELKNVIYIAKKVAQTDTTVLLRGETGVGKEVFAKAIHEASPFSDGPFVALNMASIPETLIESELFGYEAGAFTGAQKGGKPGLIEQAEGGTLFLDEIGEISPILQSKLLRVLQEREVIRVGGTKARSVRFRLIAATNRNLESMVENGKFRPDFYYRISVIPIHLPPLRERASDVLLLAEHFKRQLEERHGRQKAFSPRVLDMIKQYSWPGNVRELQSCIEYMYVLSEGQLLDVQHLPQHIWESVKGNQNAIGECREETPAPSLKKEAPAKANLKEVVEQVEKEMIIKALRESRTKTEAIQRLGMSRKGFYMKLKKYQLTF
ncbi:sigma 54-interacting transcriptional regulator [Polycladomyces sp. WAk]|uniref:Sigma 54-interacting transcriptional regulator n=1 Tax=Polycladomyces zharkentensis TaxID=2807616 RepID=A0ABS2WJ03_9BACL|nr:sigma 54-interacting transcriptional regulator [Polycladomyces sp. WAk]MBN2909507.1 sigma 54-interacting transcriptional regulator [Polycladomyces sp. WAk]